MSTATLSPAPLVTIQLFETLAGYSEKAVQRKIETGAWVEGHEYIRAPDGRVLVDMEGFAKWARGQRKLA
jgi:hypothetical protein